jgi:GDSL-like lipase/acylhydrolase family protein
MRKILAGILLLAALVFAINVLLVIIGTGVSVEVLGMTVRSIRLEFPLIASIVCGMLYFPVTGKYKEGILVVLSACFALIAAEIVLRIANHPLAKAHVDYSMWYRPSEYFGHELIPNFEGLGPLGVPVKINSFGFRDEEHERKKPNGTIRVLCLGDSFTFGWGVKVEETFLKRLERTLQVRSGRPVEVINAGVPGWGLAQYDRYLKRDGLEYSPDIIVIAYFADDLDGPRGASLISNVPPSVHNQDVPVKGGILHHSRLFNFMKSVGHWVMEKNRRARTGYLHDFDERRKEWSKRINFLMVKPDDQANRKFKGYLKDYLREFKDEASKRQSALVIMFIPDISQLFHPETQYINQVLAETTRELKIPFVDMTTTFEMSSDPGFYYLWPKDPHTNVRGHYAMAEALQQLVCDPVNVANVTCGQAAKL